MENLADLYRVDPAHACRLALRRTRKIDERHRLEKINELLEMHGVEAIRGEWENGYWCDVVAEYCNAGDTYDCTVVHTRGGRFLVTTLGDYVETKERNGHRFQ